MEPSKPPSLKTIINNYAIDVQRLGNYYDKLVQNSDDLEEDDFDIINQAYREYDLHFAELEQNCIKEIEKLFDTHAQTVLNAVG